MKNINTFRDVPNVASLAQKLAIYDLDILDIPDEYCCLEEADFAIDPSDYAPSLPRPIRSNRGSHGIIGLIRYPGGKAKLLKPILSQLDLLFCELGADAEYREPFLGAGAVAMAYLKNQPGRKAWLNDGDPSLATLWDVAIRAPESLKMMVSVFSDALDPGYFYYYKDKLRSIRTQADLGRFDRGWVALAKLAVHQLSFSGLGTCAGGPMGGRGQRDPNAVGSRYNPAGLCGRISVLRDIVAAIHLREGGCTCLDFARLFEPGEAGFYIDPPYYQAGPGLYQFSFTHEDHERLASLLRQETRPWLLSYDDHPVIRELYRGWSRVEEIGMNCTINGPNKKIELLISSL